jgi:VanZ family protein
MRLPSLFSRPGIWLVGYALWLVALYIFSSFPKIPSPNIGHVDKVAHIGYFFLGSLTLGIGISLGRAPGKSITFGIVMTILCSAIAIGVLDEFHQSFVPGRSGNDLPDLLADTVGALLACAALPISLKFVRAASRPAPA